MTRAWDDLIAEHVLGTLPDAERAEMEATLAASAEARREEAQLRAAIDQWSEALPVKTPPPEGKRRLFAALDGPERFRPFFPLLTARFDLEEAALLPLLAKVDDPGAWLRAPFPKVGYFNFTPGPAAAAAEGGFLRVAAGASFPPHEHHAREVAVVLQGTLLLEGRSLHPGDVVEMEAGSSHDFTAGPARDLIVIVAHSGITFHQ